MRAWTRSGRAALAALALLLPSGGAWAQAVGFVAAFEGHVEIQAAGAGSWAAAVIDRDLAIGDRVRTGAASGVKMLLADETILALGEETELEIDSYLLGSAATRDPSVLQLLKGKARVLVGEAFGGPTRLEMHTPTAVIGVKGTKFEAYVVEDPESGIWTLVCNLGGSIFVRQIDARTGRSVTPRLELCTRVFRARPPEDEIPRPEGFAPVPIPASRPTPGLAQVLGAPGVGAAAGGGGKLLQFALTGGGEGTPGAAPIGSLESGLGSAAIEDAQQARAVSGAPPPVREPGEPVELPLPGGEAPQPPPP